MSAAFLPSLSQRQGLDTWEIISIGDIEYLRIIYTAAASLADGTLATIGSIGFLVALLMVGFKGLMSGGKEFPLQNLLIAFVVWVVFFGSAATGWAKVNVALVDKYTGETVIVGQVPRGVAIPQSILSRMGLGLTEMMETLFSTPNMAQHEFGSALHTIAALRELGGASVALSNALQDPELARDVRNLERYIGDCRAPDLARVPGLASAVMTAANALAMLETANQGRHTVYEEAPSGGEPGALVSMDNCQEAMSRIQADLGAGLEAKVNRAMSSGGRGDFVTYLAGAYERLGQTAGQISVHDQVRNMVVAAAWRGGVRRAMSQAADTQTAAMMEVAAIQRNVQWAGEQDLFMRYMRPVCTFIEGLLVALTPMIALLIAAGLGGIGTAMKYVLIAVWIQLWFPLLAIINLYVTITTGRRIEALREMAERDPASIAGTMELISHTMDWLGTAGMLAASVPAIALMLAWGGAAIAATHLAGRLQGQDFINEKVMAPDVIAPAPVLQQEPSAMVSPYGGVYKRGADAEVGSYSVTAGESARTTEAASEAYKAHSQYMSQVGSVLARNEAFTESWQSSVRDSFRSSAGQDDARRVESRDTESVGRAVGHAVSRGLKTNASERFQFQANADPIRMAQGIAELAGASRAMQALPGAGLGPTEAASQMDKLTSQVQGAMQKISPGINMSYADAREFMNTLGSEGSNRLANDLERSATSTGSFGWFYQRGMERAADSVHSNQASLGLSSQDSQSLSMARGEMRERSLQLSEARESSLAGTVGMNGSFLPLSHFAAEQGQAYVGGLVDRAQDLGMGDLYQANLARAERLGIGGDWGGAEPPLQARSMAALWTLSGQGGYPHNVQHQGASEAARGTFGDVVGDMHAIRLPGGVTGMQLPALPSVIPSPGAVAAEVEGGVGAGLVPSREQVQSGSSAVQGQQGSIEWLQAEGGNDAAVRDFQAQAIGGTMDRRDAAFEQLQPDRAAHASAQYHSLAGRLLQEDGRGLGERFMDSVQGNRGPAGLFGSGDYDELKAFYMEKTNDPAMSAGLAAGYVAGRGGEGSRWDQHTRAMEFLERHEDLGQEELARASPMAALGVLQRVNLDHQGVVGTIQQVRSIDAMKSPPESR